MDVKSHPRRRTCQSSSQGNLLAVATARVFQIPHECCSCSVFVYDNLALMCIVGCAALFENTRHERMQTIRKRHTFAGISWFWLRLGVVCTEFGSQGRPAGNAFGEALKVTTTEKTEI